MMNLCEEGKANCEVVCRAGDVECMGWDKIYDHVEFNFDNNMAVIDFDHFTSIDIKRK